MAGMRAQLSLQFADEDLFYNFVKPYKEQRLLNNLIIKCLSAYYYDEEVRDKIEGVSMSDATGETVSSTQDICDSIRQALMMQDFMVQEMQSTIDNGTEDITNILSHSNEMAEETGVAKTTSSSSGASILKIGVSVSDNKEQPSSHKQNIDSANTDLKTNLLIKAVEILAKASGNVEVIKLFDDFDESGVAVEPKNVSETTQSEVSTEPVIEEPVSNDIEVEDDVVIDEDTFKPDEIPEPVKEVNVVEEIPEVKEFPVVASPINEEDASSSVDDLLSSLF